MLTLLMAFPIPTGLTGTALSQYAFSSVFGKFGNVFIAICMFFFAFSTIIGWYFFGQANVKYLFGKKAVKPYAVLVSLCVLLGSLAQVDLVWNMADCFNSLMVIPNILALFFLSSQMKELQSTIRGRDRLYSVIAHDLRSPMGSLKMIFNLLMAQLPPEKIGPEMYDMLSMANHTAEETFSLLDNLLKWTKSQIGRLKTVYQEIDMMEVIGDAVTLFSPVASLKNIKIRTEWPDHVDVRVDVDMIKTIMRNLLSNAVKYSPEGSEIIVTVEDLGEKAVVNVRDFGKGIPEEDQPKLFHSDTHFTTYGTHNEEGSGLGLLLCKDFAHKNNGDLWFSSKAGEGSTFSFSVPTRTGAAAMNASADSANAPASL